jgi:hypothetical protein
MAATIAISRVAWRSRRASPIQTKPGLRIREMRTIRQSIRQSIRQKLGSRLGSFRPHSRCLRDGRGRSSLAESPGQASTAPPCRSFSLMKRALARPKLQSLRAARAATSVLSRPLLPRLRDRCAMYGILTARVPGVLTIGILTACCAWEKPTTRTRGHCRVRVSDNSGGPHMT